MHTDIDDDEVCSVLYKSAQFVRINTKIVTPSRQLLKYTNTSK